MAILLYAKDSNSLSTEDSNSNIYLQKIVILYLQKIAILLSTKDSNSLSTEDGNYSAIYKG